MSVTTTSAPLTASRGSFVQKISLSHPNFFTTSHTGLGHWYAAFGGVAMRILWPRRGSVTSRSCKTFELSPTHVTVRGGRGSSELALSGLIFGTRPKAAACSCRVSTSASVWVGCQREERALITGTAECSASSFESESEEGYRVSVWTNCQVKNGRGRIPQSQNDPQREQIFLAPYSTVLC